MFYFVHIFIFYILTNLHLQCIYFWLIFMSSDDCLQSNYMMCKGQGKVKLSLDLINHHAVKAYGEIKLSQHHS
jgi:hypothetical protein